MCRSLRYNGLFRSFSNYRVDNEGIRFEKIPLAPWAFASVFGLAMRMEEGEIKEGRSEEARTCESKKERRTERDEERDARFDRVAGRNAKRNAEKRSDGSSAVRAKYGCISGWRLMTLLAALGQYSSRIFIYSALYRPFGKYVA